MSTTKADVEKAEKAVDTWLGQLEKIIQSAGDGQPKEKTILKRKDGLEDRWSSYEELFMAYLRLVKSDDDKQKLQEEFDERMDKYLSTSVAAEEVLDTIRAAATRPVGGLNIDLTKKKIKMEKDKISRVVQELENQTNMPDLTPQQVKGLQTDHQNIMDSVENILTKMYHELIEHDSQDVDHLTELQTYVDPIRVRLASIKFSILGMIPEETASSRENTPSPSQISGSASQINLRQGYYKRQDFPKFSGEARDYPSFAKRWRNTVEPFLPPELQLDQIMLSVPKKTESKLKTCQTMDAVWEKLEDEFGKKEEVALLLLDGLSKMTLSSKNDHENFVKLYDKFTEVKYDLKEIDRDRDLREQRSIRDVVSKFPKEIRNSYFNFQVERQNTENTQTGEDWTEWSILNTFLERQIKISRN